MAAVIGRPDPYTVVIIEGIRLPAYAAGGVNLSVGQLARVDTADVYPGRASGAWTGSGGCPYEFHATSGSGNIVTVSVFMKGSASEAIAGQQFSSLPLTLVAYGH